MATMCTTNNTATSAQEAWIAGLRWIDDLGTSNLRARCPGGGHRAIMFNQPRVTRWMHR
jgi:hypothetical protein